MTAWARSQRPGLDADFALYDGSPMDLRTRVRMTIVNGQVRYEG